jgi:hypothetical protein
MSEDLVSKFDALTARFRSEYELFQALNRECIQIYEEFKSCHWWQFKKQYELVVKLHDRHVQAAERISKMAEVQEEVTKTRKEMEALLRAVERDIRKMQ